MQGSEKGLQMGSTRSEKDIKQMKRFVERTEIKNTSMSSRAEMYKLGLTVILLFNKHTVKCFNILKCFLHIIKRTRT